MRLRCVSLAACLLLIGSSARAQPLTGGGGGGGAGSATALYVSFTSVPSGADVSEDTLQSYTLPANSLVNPGDKLRIFAGGAANGNTDNKLIRLRIGSGGPNILSAMSIVTASGTRWSMYTEIVKTGPNAQLATMLPRVANSASADGLGQTATAVPDTAPITLSITGQNTTNPTAASLTCGYFSVEIVRAPAS